MDPPLLGLMRQKKIAHGVYFSVEAGENHRRRVILIDDSWTFKGRPGR
jgi:hypothetical protein